jgi:toxin ParE1/3/4
MAKVFFTLQAKQDLKDIAQYIALDNKSTAIAYIKMLQGKCKKLADSPKIGVQYGTLRKFPVGNYLIFYREQKKNIEIIRVLHANRDINALMT